MRSWLWVVVKPLTSSPGDADDDLRRPEPGHLLGLLEGHRAIVDDRGDIRDRARLHVREALPLATDAPHRPQPRLVDLEDQGLGELGPDVERGADRQALRPVALPDPAPEGHQAFDSTAVRTAS